MVLTQLQRQGSVPHLSRFLQLGRWFPEAPREISQDPQETSQDPPRKPHRKHPRKPPMKPPRKPPRKPRKIPPAKLQAKHTYITTFSGVVTPDSSTLATRMLHIHIYLSVCLSTHLYAAACAKRLRYAASVPLYSL